MTLMLSSPLVPVEAKRPRLQSLLKQNSHGNFRPGSFPSAALSSAFHPGATASQVLRLEQAWSRPQGRQGLQGLLGPGRLGDSLTATEGRSGVGESALQALGALAAMETGVVTFLRPQDSCPWEGKGEGHP